VRRLVNDFEDRLAGRYGQPQTIPVPDELDPNLPRVMFQSLGGHSQVAISQVSVSLNVTYDQEWMTDELKRDSYLRERVPLTGGRVGLDSRTWFLGDDCSSCGCLFRLLRL
jgi:hypothetical protein